MAPFRRNGNSHKHSRQYSPSTVVTPYSQPISLLQESPSDDLRVTTHRSVQTLQQQWRRVEHHRKVADVSFRDSTLQLGRETWQRKVQNGPRRARTSQ